MSSSAAVATAATPSQQRQRQLQQQRQLLVQEKEKHVQLLQQTKQQKQQQLIQQQQQMRANSLEKEIEKKRLRQLEQENPNRAPRPTSITEKALENPAFIQHVLNSPENVDTMLNETETSVYELLYKDPIDYTGEHLMEAFSFQPILKRYEINGIDVERLKKLKAGLNDDRWSSRMIKRAKAEIESNEESWTMFKAKKSMTTIPQKQTQIEQELEQEDNNNNSNSNNVFNELITYYNNGGNGGGGINSDFKQK
jgi:hypothetical protein